MPVRAAMILALGASATAVSARLVSGGYELRLNGTVHQQVR
jgi:hypothetical protein